MVTLNSPSTTIALHRNISTAKRYEGCGLVANVLYYVDSFFFCLVNSYFSDFNTICVCLFRFLFYLLILPIIVNDSLVYESSYLNFQFCLYSLANILIRIEIVL